MGLPPHLNTREVEKFSSGPNDEVLVNVGCPSGALVTDKTTTANTTYIGVAALGSLTSAAVWQIFQIVDSSGDKTITWADSNADYDNVWDNRAALTYG